MKWFILIELNQQNSLLVIAGHLDALCVQSARVQRTNQI